MNQPQTPAPMQPQQPMPTGGAPKSPIMRLWILIVLVVVILAAAAYWWFGIRNSSSGYTTTSTSPTPTATVALSASPATNTSPSKSPSNVTANTTITMDGKCPSFSVSFYLPAGYNTKKGVAGEYFITDQTGTEKLTLTNISSAECKSSSTFITPSNVIEGPTNISVNGTSGKQWVSQTSSSTPSHPETLYNTIKYSTLIVNSSKYLVVIGANTLGVQSPNKTYQFDTNYAAILNSIKFK